jgi:hypothetical protein
MDNPIKTRSIRTKITESVVLIVFVMAILIVNGWVSFDDKSHLPGWYMCVSVK